MTDTAQQLNRTVQDIAGRIIPGPHGTPWARRQRRQRRAHRPSDPRDREQELGQLHGGMFASAREMIPRPSEHPDRKEGVSVVASSPHGEVLLTLIFDRDKENKPLPRASMTTR